MMSLFIFIFILVPIAELFFFVQVSSAIGFWNSLLNLLV